MPEKKRRLSRSETLRENRKNKYYDLFPEKKPEVKSGGEMVMDMKRKNRMCKDCDPVNLVLSVNDKWMCFYCKHSPYKQDDWI